MTVPRQEIEMTTPPCTECKHCNDRTYQEIGYYWCNFDECFISEEYALSDIECDAYEPELDDNKTEESSA